MSVFLCVGILVFFQCCGAGADFFWSEPGAGATFFKAAPAASFSQAKKKSLVLVSNMTLRAYMFRSIYIYIYSIHRAPAPPRPMAQPR